MKGTIINPAFRLGNWDLGNFSIWLVHLTELVSDRVRPWKTRLHSQGPSKYADQHDLSKGMAELRALANAKNDLKVSVIWNSG